MSLLRTLRPFLRTRQPLFTSNTITTSFRHYFSPNTSPLPPANDIPGISHQDIPTTPVRKRNSKKERRKFRRDAQKFVDPTSSSGVLIHEVKELCEEMGVVAYKVPMEVISHYRRRGNSRVVEGLRILRISSTGLGLGITPSEDGSGHLVVVVPFTTEGDVVKVELGVHFEQYAEGHIVEVQQSSQVRRDDLVGCKYFTKCSGCQLQMLSYEDQLKFKTQVVRRAYHQFGFHSSDLPISDTVGSPLEYGYRTKLTPHFNSNREEIMLGFEKAGLGKGLFNVDSCSIATDTLSKALQRDRPLLEEIVRKYKKGGTVLLRDKSIGGKLEYTTNHTEVITQQINGYKFQFPAGEFFQNNNSILPVLLDHIREFIDPTKHKNIVDTYCGSGFFGISLSKYAERLIGIEISKGSLEFAQHNAELNNVQNSQFLLGSSEEIFRGLDSFNPDETIVILDPSRKGSNEDYLTQLSEFKASLIVYVSCNVFSQARDLHYFINNTYHGQEYEVKTIRGYDFFPQSKHVESLAVLELRKPCT